MSRWLVDTGPIMAYLDAGDSQHESVAEALNAFRGHLVTTSAVVTEAMFFLGDTTRGPKLLAEFVGSSEMRVYDFAGRDALWEVAELMERYSDTPMDYADATLVLLAEALDVRSILTLDRRGFSTYRTPTRKSFQLVLEL